MTIEPVDSVCVIERMKIAAKAEENAPTQREERADEARALVEPAPSPKNVRRGQRMMTMPTKPIAVAVQRIDADRSRRG